MASTNLIYFVLCIWFVRFESTTCSVVWQPLEEEKMLQKIPVPNCLLLSTWRWDEQWCGLPSRWFASFSGRPNGNASPPYRTVIFCRNLPQLAKRGCNCEGGSFAKTVLATVQRVAAFSSLDVGHTGPQETNRHILLHTYSRSRS